MPCRSGCLTKDHSSYGECLRAADARASFGETASKWVESELADYRRLRAEGIQPAGTTRRAIDAAMQISDTYGGAFDASTGLVNGKMPTPSGELI